MKPLKDMPGWETWLGDELDGEMVEVGVQEVRGK